MYYYYFFFITIFNTSGTLSSSTANRIRKKTIISILNRIEMSRILPKLRDGVLEDDDDDDDDEVAVVVVLDVAVDL